MAQEIGAGCQACGAFVSAPEVLAHHRCDVFARSHDITTTALMRLKRSRPKDKTKS